MKKDELKNRLYPYNLCYILRIMKLTILLLIIGMGTAFSETYSQTTLLSLEANKLTVREALLSIETKSEYVFLFSDEINAVMDKKVDINIKYQSLDRILDKLLENSSVSYKIIDRQVTLYKNREIQPAARLNAAQQNGIRITGTIWDENKEPIIGANILVKGTTLGTITNLDGKYEINVASRDAVLVVSYIGHTTKEIAIGNRTTIDVVLASAFQEIEEIVVTALGLQREKKALGYAVQDIKGEEVSKSKQMDVVNALAGHVSGVHITHGDGGLGGGSSRIVIRGENAISGNNMPLFIIDGVPGGANDVAADDIETISVLKGPAASALYGSRALSGVVVITTKSGKGKSGLSVEINSNSMWQDPLILPEYQTDYGQGQGGIYGFNNDQSWGAYLDGQGHSSNAKDFYDTGYVLTNNVAISKTQDKSNNRLSYTNITQKGIVPNTDLTINRFDFSSSWELFQDFTVSANVKYILKNSNNDQVVDPRRWPVNIDLADLKNYWKKTGEQQNIWKEQTDNPYFSLYENLHPWENERWFTNASFNYKFLQHLSLMGRMSYITESGQSEWFVKPGSEGTDNGHDRQYGGYSTEMSRNKELNTDFLFSYENRFLNSDLFVKGSVGGNHTYSSLDNRIWGKTYQLLTGVPIYTLGNYQTYPRMTSNYGPDKITNSLYAFVNLGYKNMLYMDITGRNDWSSTLPPQNNSYFYPSVSLSAILSEMIELPKVISFWKVRTSYASVGNDTNPGVLQPDFSFTEGSGGVAGITEGATRREYNLKPELASSFEIGTDLRLFNNRLSLDMNYYSTNTRNQIWNVAISNISGYSYAMKNAGKVNSHGFEVSINAEPVKVADFSWHTGINWSLDRSTIKELDADNPDLVYTVNFAELMYTHDKLGERRGALYSRYAKKFEYDPSIHSADLAAYDGAMLHDPAKKIQRSDELTVLGNYNPDWIGSWHNSFQYKGFNLSVMLFCNYGNSFFAGFEKAFYRYGFAPETGVARNNGGVLPTNELWQEIAGDPSSIHPFRPGDEINAETYYKEHIGDGENNDYWIRDGSFLKLKELSLTYTFPKAWLRQSFVKGVNLSLIGRDLAVWSEVKYVDPEIYVTGSGSKTIPGASLPDGSIPSTRSIGFSVNLQF
jgi:TonB-linked SusC/RagA family outer membrane protein